MIFWNSRNVFDFKYTISFIGNDTLMPSYTKFLKDIFSNKRSLNERRKVVLNLECSATLRRESPPKLKDLGNFTIPCTIGKTRIRRALCDLGASVSLMPHTVFKRIWVGELKPTRLTIQLADSSIRAPIGIVEDVPILVGKYFYTWRFRCGGHEREWGCTNHPRETLP